MKIFTIPEMRLIDRETELSAHDNDNWGVCSSWQTPAEAMQKIRRMKKEMRQELTADATLWRCPTHTRHRIALEAMERCALWHYYGVR